MDFAQGKERENVTLRHIPDLRFAESIDFAQGKECEKVIM